MNVGRKRKKTFQEELVELSAADPEFYDYIRREETDLLNGEDSSSQHDSESEDCRSSTSEVDGENLLRLEGVDGQTFEIATDKDTGLNLADEKLIKFLRPILKNPNEHKRLLDGAVKIGASCLQACLERFGQSATTAATNRHESMGNLRFIVRSEQVCDSLIDLCTRHMPVCLTLLLDPFRTQNEPKSANGKNGKFRRNDSLATSRFRHWRKYRTLLRQYLKVHLKLLTELEEGEPFQTAILQTQHLAGLFVRFKKLFKELIKVLAEFWATESEGVRRASYITLRKMAQCSGQMDSLVYENCYRVFLSNTKFTNAETSATALISYMRRSFAKLCQTNPGAAHKLASLYVRRLAIDLRRAVVAKKKDLVKTVYNWQFLQALHLWTTVLVSSTGDIFKDLQQPLVEIITILRRLFVSPRYLPLRIHCVKMMIQIQLHNDVFIPTLAAAVELLEDLVAIDAKKPNHSKDAPKLKPLNEILSLKRAHLEEISVRHQLAEAVCQLIEESAEIVRYHPAYQCLMVPIDERLRKFVKTCQNREHIQMVKELKKRLREVPNTVTSGASKRRKLPNHPDE